MLGSNLANAGVSLVAVLLIGGTLRVVGGTMILSLDRLWGWLPPAQRIRRAYRRS